MAVSPKRLIDGTQIAASLTSYYTATNCSARIDAMALTNTGSGAINVSVHLVPAGDSPDLNNIILEERPIAAGETYIPPGAIGQWLEAGGQIYALASVATNVAIVASGIEFRP